MTDTVHSLTVVLASDIRTDDVEPLMMAIRQFRGVIDVTHIVADIDSHMAEQRAVRQLGDKLFEVLYPKSERKGG